MICSFRVGLFVDTRPRRPDKVAPRFDRLTLRKRPRRNVLREPNGMELIILYSFSRLGMAASSVTAAGEGLHDAGGHIGVRRGPVDRWFLGPTDPAWAVDLAVRRAQWSGCRGTILLSAANDVARLLQD